MFQHVHLRYTPPGQAALENLDLRIEAGEKLGICGRTGTLRGVQTSGSGKLAHDLRSGFKCVRVKWQGPASRPWWQLY